MSGDKNLQVGERLEATAVARRRHHAPRLIAAATRDADQTPRARRLPVVAADSKAKRAGGRARALIRSSCRPSIAFARVSSRPPHNDEIPKRAARRRRRSLPLLLGALSPTSNARRFVITSLDCHRRRQRDAADFSEPTIIMSRGRVQTRGAMFASRRSSFVSGGVFGIAFCGRLLTSICAS